MSKPFEEDSMQEQYPSQGRGVTPRGKRPSLFPLWEHQRARRMAEAEVEAVLAELVATGMVREVKEKDGQTRYGVEPQKVRAIETHLKEFLEPSRDQRRL